jgi:hypothetical protein
MKNESILYFATVGGTYVDFTNLDLSPWGIKGGFIENKSTKDFIQDNSTLDSFESNWKHLKDIAQSSDGNGGAAKHVGWEFINLLWPIDLNNPPSEEDYFEAIGAIKVIHPSELYIQHVMDAQYFEDLGFNFSGWRSFNNYAWYKYKEPENHYFIYYDSNYEETNNFLALYKEKARKRDYIRNAITYYLDSFSEITIRKYIL